MDKKQAREGHNIHKENMEVQVCKDEVDGLKIKPVGDPGTVWDENAVKRTVANGLLNISLMASNTSQLKAIYLIGAESHPYYYPLMTLLPLSIFLQILIAITIMLTGKVVMDRTGGSGARADGVQTTGTAGAKLSSETLLMIYNMKKFLVILVVVGNIFISCFSFMK